MQTKKEIEKSNEEARKTPCGPIITPTESGETYEGTGVTIEEHPLKSSIRFQKTCPKCGSKNILITYAKFQVHMHSGDVYWDYKGKCNDCDNIFSSSFAEND